MRHSDKAIGFCAGCLAARTRNRTHGKSSPESPEYEPWKGIMKCCHNPRDVRFQYYGGRGIKVCHLIARIDDEGDHRPSNCRWATVKKQRATKQENTDGFDHEDLRKGRSQP